MMALSYYDVTVLVMTAIYLPAVLKEEESTYSSTESYTFQPF